MSQHVTEPTRGSSNNPNVLDLILSNNEDIIGDVENINPFGRSDHCILTFEILCTIKLNNYTKRRKYYKNADFDRIKIEFSKIYWKTKFKDSDTNVNRQWEILDRIKTTGRKYVPQKEISNHRKGNFPLNAKTRKLIRHKNRLRIRYMETRKMGRNI